MLTAPLRTRSAGRSRPGSRSEAGPLERAFGAFLPVRPPSFGEGRREGAGRRVGVGERARRPSVVVSWLRAAVAK